MSDDAYFAAREALLTAIAQATAAIEPRSAGAPSALEHLAHAFNLVAER